MQKMCLNKFEIVKIKNNKKELLNFIKEIYFVIFTKNISFFKRLNHSYFTLALYLSKIMTVFQQIELNILLKLHIYITFIFYS